MKIIEFYGMPGSGKTFLSKQLANKCESGIVCQPTLKIAEKNAVFRMLYKIAVNIKTLSFSPSKYIRILRELFKTKQKTLYDFLIVFVNYLYILHIYNTKWRCDYVILDQGIFQAIWSITFAQKNETNIEEIFDALEFPVADLTCIVTVTPGKIKTRLQERKVNKSRLGINGTKKHNFKKSYCHFNEINSYIEEKQMPYIEIVNEFDDCRKSIEDCYLKILTL